MANGASFDVNLAVNTSVAVRGWQANLSFDAAKLTLNSISEGTFLSDYATANGGGTVSGGIATINNTAGTAAIPGFAISGAGTGGPTGAGTLAVLHFTAKADVNNMANIGITSIVLSDTVAATISGVAMTGGTAAIGTLPLADLTVSNVVASGVTGALNTYNVSFQVNNVGNANAGASSASIVVEGGTPIVISVPAINAGANTTVTTTAPISISGSNDTFIITADSAVAIVESNESNNTANGSYSYVAPLSGNTTDINGDIVGNLSFTQPTAIDFGNFSLARTP